MLYQLYEYPDSLREPTTTPSSGIRYKYRILIPNKAKNPPLSTRHYLISHNINLAHTFKQHDAHTTVSYTHLEIASSFVIVGGDSPIVFEFSEELFNQMACFIKFLVVGVLDFAVGFGE